MDARPASDERAWEAFVRSQPESQFLQSWRWGEFQVAVGRGVERFVVVDGGSIVAACQAIIQRHPLGVVSYNIYRGPVVSERLPPDAYQRAVNHLLALLETSAARARTTYIHVEPSIEERHVAARLFRERPGWRAAPSSQPRATLILSLTPDEETLLSSMHEKTRYNIRLAERKGVTVERLREPDAVSAFLRLQHVTARRDGIRLHRDSYYEALLRILAPVDRAELFLAWFDGDVIAANIVVRYGDTVTYVHGASGDRSRNVMAPHLLQWRQIQWAKSLGARWYDVWGIAPSTAGDKHSWAGITRFKKGFGGEERQYLGAFEKPVRSWLYRLVKLRQSLRVS